MIPMRDGVRLHTVILVPKGAKGAPILLTRTPYDATALTSHAYSSHLGPILQGYDNATDVIVGGGYIRVVEDVRGKYGSEGDYVMNRPLRGPLNPTAVDHATDTYDTIDWLVKNVPETNGRVGILGISYDGFLPLMALFGPHPALKVSVPMNPMVDGWMGDDWFHNGAFRQQMMPYIYEQEGTRANDGDARWFTRSYDDYDTYMQAGSAGELARRRGLDQMGFWQKIGEHPAYDAFWREQAVDKLLAAQPLQVPVMLVHSLWDQEDIYGAPAVYKAIEPKDAANDKVFLVLGPWHHGQEIGDGSTPGALNFHSDTGLYFRQQILRPFLDHFLKDDVPAMDVAPVTAFETGTNEWRRLPAWPAGCASGCSITPAPLYLGAGLKATYDAPRAGDAPFEEYVSDPSKPVPYRARPNQPAGGPSWARWLVDDQREASGRPDVLAFVSDVLTRPVKISGQPIATLVASTSGTDADWVVKVIDVRPDGFAQNLAVGIQRGSFRDSELDPTPLTPGKTYRIAVDIAHAAARLQAGHKLRVEITGSYFPLYDRNTNTAEGPTSARTLVATEQVLHAPGAASRVILRVIGKAKR